MEKQRIQFATSGDQLGSKLIAESCPRVWHGLWIVGAIGLVLRIVFALVSDNIHHPDEVFNYLEQAHRLVFGYGIIPWEYRFGTRSWITPYIVSAPLLLCKFLHLDYPSIYIPIVKCCFCTASLSLVFSGYSVARSLVSETAGRLTAVLMASWYELIYFSPRPLTDAIGAYLLMAALACVVRSPSRSNSILIGFLTAAGCIVRIQYAPLGLLLMFVATLKLNKSGLTIAVASALIVVLAAGYIDYLTWGEWFVSYYNNFVYNSILGVSELFGHADWDYYCDKLFIGSTWILAIGFACGFLFFCRLWILLCGVAAIVGVHSLIPHKEYRFIFASIPILLTLTACVITLFSDEYQRARRAVIAGCSAIVMFGISMVGIANWLPDEQRIYRFQPLYSRDPMLHVFKLLSSEGSVAAVYVEPKNFAHTGGYYYLHLDIPLYFKEDVERMSDNNQPGLVGYVSHIVCLATSESHAGFVTVGEIGTLQIRKQQNPPHGFQRLPSYSRNVAQKGVDDTFTPTVTPMAIDN